MITYAYYSSDLVSLVKSYRIKASSQALELYQKTNRRQIAIFPWATALPLPLPLLIFKHTVAPTHFYVS